MSVPTYVVRAMLKKEIPQALALWKETGLQEGNHCLDTWFEVDPLGFWVAVTDEDQVIGACAAVLHHDDLAFVGMYVVDKEYRGHGIGVKVWQACMDHIGDRNAAVNAVPGKLEIYRDRGGFPVEETEWYSISTEAESVDTSLLKEELLGVSVKPLTSEHYPMVLEYDASVINYRRDKIITLTTQEKDSCSFIAVENNQCVGYGVYKVACQGHGLVGPLYADNQDIAEIILRNLVESLPQAKGFAMMIVSTNKNARAIIDKLKVNLHEECPRCYKKFELNVDRNKVFGQLDLNFSPY